MRQFPPIFRWVLEHNLGTYLKNKYSSFFSLNLKEGLQMLPGVPPWPAPHQLPLVIQVKFRQEHNSVE